jgi:hypothetical protein
MTFLAMIAAFISSLWDAAPGPLVIVVVVLAAVVVRWRVRWKRRAALHEEVMIGGCSPGHDVYGPGGVDEFAHTDVTGPTQGVEQYRPSGNYLEAFAEERGIVGREHLAHAASHTLVDYLCAVTGRTYRERHSEDMRRVEAMFFQAFVSGDCTPRKANLGELASSSGTEQSLPEPVYNLLGSQERL